MPVPLFDTRTPLLPLRAELDAAIAGVVDSGAFILGPQVTAFEEEFAAYLGVREAVGEASLAWLAPAGNPEAMAERIVLLAEDTAVRARIGQANALRIQNEFSVERRDAEMGALLASALRDRRWP